MLDLQQMRTEIDSIDSQLVQLFEKRMEITSNVARYKIETGKKVLDTEREKQKLQAISAQVTKEENKHAINELFSQIMANSRKGQYMLLESMGQTLREEYEAVDSIQTKGCKVVYQGVPGAYGHKAMCNFFGEDADNFNVPTFREAMEVLSVGKADYAVLPIENSTAGIVSEVYDLLQEFNNYIVAEEYVKIEHALLGIKGTDLEKVNAVYSHPQGLMQCQKFLEQHRDWMQYGEKNTAICAKKIVEDGDPTHVAIASVDAARIYGLEVLKEKINTQDNNTTRFVIVSNKRRFKKDARKVSISFETGHTAGCLYDLLSHIIYNGLNMVKIESRPIEGKPWQFRFFIDFLGNIDEQPVMNALRGIEEEALSIKLLGNY